MIQNPLPVCPDYQAVSCSAELIVLGFRFQFFHLRLPTGLPKTSKNARRRTILFTYSFTFRLRRTVLDKTFIAEFQKQEPSSK